MNENVDVRIARHAYLHKHSNSATPNEMKKIKSSQASLEYQTVFQVLKRSVINFKLKLSFKFQTI